MINGNFLIFLLINRMKSKSIKMFLNVFVCNFLNICNVFKCEFRCLEFRCLEICVEWENDLFEILR